jgi:hypothetical protein
VKKCPKGMKRVRNRKKVKRASKRAAYRKPPFTG